MKVVSLLALHCQHANFAVTFEQRDGKKRVVTLLADIRKVFVLRILARMIIQQRKAILQDGSDKALSEPEPDLPARYASQADVRSQLDLPL